MYCRQEEMQRATGESHLGVGKGVGSWGGRRAGLSRVAPLRTASLSKDLKEERQPGMGERVAETVYKGPGAEGAVLACPRFSQGVVGLKWAGGAKQEPWEGEGEGAHGFHEDSGWGGSGANVGVSRTSQSACRAPMEDQYGSWSRWGDSGTWRGGVVFRLLRSSPEHVPEVRGRGPTGFCPETRGQCWEVRSFSLDVGGHGSEVPRGHEVQGPQRTVGFG